MGGWMDYQRMRNRNNVGLRVPYLYPSQKDAPGGVVPNVAWACLVGDMNRMEQDYLSPVYPQPPFATRPAGSSPAEECAAATGVPVEVVQRVLAHVFGVDPTTPGGEAMSERTDEQLRADIASLRRTARWSRATPGQLRVGIDLDRIANEREAELARRAAAPTTPEDGKGATDE